MMKKEERTIFIPHTRNSPPFSLSHTPFHNFFSYINNTSIGMWGYGEAGKRDLLACEAFFIFPLYGWNIDPLFTSCVTLISPLES